MYVWAAPLLTNSDNRVLKKYFSSYWIRSAFYTILQRFSFSLFGVISLMVLVRHLTHAQYGVFALFLLSFAGIPLTSGFVGKFAVFQAAIAGGDLALVVVGVVASAIAAFFYARVIVLMFFSDPVPDGPVVTVPSVFTGIAVGVGALSTVVLGVFPEPVLSLANHAATQLFVR